jgi:hypothetical protein
MDSAASGAPAILPVATMAVSPANWSFLPMERDQEVRNGATLTATGSVGSFSDARLKNNIEPFTDGLNVIEQINPVQFHYNADAPFVTPEKQVGIVAQELEKVAPYMVHQTAEGSVKDMRWVDNQAYVFLLINAVKELKLQVEEQQKEIEALKKGRRNR